MDRADLLQLQKTRFLQALQEIRKDMSAQESIVKEKIDKIERTGKFHELPELDLFSTLGAQDTSTFLVSKHPVPHQYLEVHQSPVLYGYLAKE